MEIGHPLNAWTFSIAGHANSYGLANDLCGRHAPLKGAGSRLVLAVLHADQEAAPPCPLETGVLAWRHNPATGRYTVARDRHLCEFRKSSVRPSTLPCTKARHPTGLLEPGGRGRPKRPALGRLSLGRDAERQDARAPLD